MDSVVLYVKDYGKIKEAKIKLAPFVLLVGDNNSGKSYLLSLIWGLYNIGTRRLFIDIDRMETQACNELMEWMDRQIHIAIEKGHHAVSLKSIYGVLFEAMNECLDSSKNKLIKWIFNSSSVKIGELKILLDDQDDLEDLAWEISYKQNQDGDNVLIMSCGTSRIRTIFDGKKIHKSSMVSMIISKLLKLPFRNLLDFSGVTMANVYIPASRTGFMLTKDIVNKIGRDKTFNIQSEIEDEIEITPFTKPINQFIDEICGLKLENEHDIKTKTLAEQIEKEMTYGSIEISSLPSREIEYLPEGLSEAKPLRVSSAVVTELSPLILLFKHRLDIQSLFYEEPEMGLHPQLQQKIAKILVETINSGVRIVSTTHSDIILQHINNMIQLKRHKKCKDICDLLGYTDIDLLDKEDVRVYQLTNKDSHTALVEELQCTEYGFEVPTFNDALDKIMNENYEIQG